MTTDNLKNQILEKIRTKRVSMRPKIFFTLHVGALIVVGFCVLALSVFLFNYISFIVRLNSHDALLGFGPRGIELFLQVFPWPLLLLDLALVVLLEWLLRHFKFGYRRPALLLFAGLLLSSLIVGSFLDRGLRFNDNFLRRADRGMLPPPLGAFYEYARRPPGPEEYRGTITAINGTQLTVQLDSTTTTITIEAPPEHGDIAVGQRIFIFGHFGTSSIQAFGIRGLPQDRDDPFVPPPAVLMK